MPSAMPAGGGEACRRRCRCEGRGAPSAMPMRGRGVPARRDVVGPEDRGLLARVDAGHAHVADLGAAVLFLAPAVVFLAPAVLFLAPAVVFLAPAVHQATDTL